MGVEVGDTEGMYVGFINGLFVGVNVGTTEVIYVGLIERRVGIVEGDIVDTTDGNMVGNVLGAVLTQIRNSFSNTSTASALTLMNGYSPKPDKSIYLSFALDPLVYNRLPKS